MLEKMKERKRERERERKRERERERERKKERKKEREREKKKERENKHGEVDAFKIINLYSKSAMLLVHMLAQITLLTENFF